MAGQQEQFDLIVIGTGSAGASVARRCRRAGWQVAVIDRRPFGGTCSQRGCDPKKILVGAAHAVDEVQRLQEKGIFPTGVKLNWPALMAFKRTFTEPIPDATVRELGELGIRMFHGTARFTGPTTIAVNEQELAARHVLIAAGARHRDLDMPGAEYLATSTDFLELNELPPHIIFVGGGYISFEFAHIAARAGAAVTIVHRSARPLSNFDPDLVDQVVAATRAAGITVHVNTPVREIVREGETYVVHGEQDGKPLTLRADLVVHGAGRVPEIDDLALDVAGVERNKQGVVVKATMQSVSNPAVYAAGDAAASGLPLTPVAGMEGRVVAANLLEEGGKEADYRAIPTVVFTIPAMASVGMQEAQAHKEGRKFRVEQHDTSSWYSSRRLNVEHSATKVLIEEGSEQILGAHLFGPNAEEVINVFALAIRAGVPASELKEMLYSYPTNGSDIQYML